MAVNSFTESDTNQLPSLHTIGGDLDYRASLGKSFNGLFNLQHVGGNLKINALSLDTLTGLQALEQIDGQLELTQVRFLEEIQSFNTEHIEQVADELENEVTSPIKKRISIDNPPVVEPTYNEAAQSESTEQDTSTEASSYFNENHQTVSEENARIREHAQASKENDEQLGLWQKLGRFFKFW